MVSANLYIWPAPYFNFIIYSPVVHFNEFLIGNLTGFVYLYLVRKGHFKKDLSLIVFISLFILCYLMADFKTLGIKPVANLHNGILSAFFAPLILLLALNKGYISKALSFRPLIFLGEISYCIYILQFPVFTFLERFFINSNSTMRFYSLLLILIVISIICYIIIELPGKKYIKIFFKPYLQFKSITDTNDELTGAAKKRDA